MRDPVQRMLDSEGWLIVKTELDAQIAAIRKLIEWGGPQEQAEYAYQAGSLRGLQSVGDITEAIVEAANRAQQSLLEAARNAEEIHA
jgi:hypothetical protein